ncbi:MAG: T9SS type A sorting domain-containing protein, partial [Flavobacteriales bacterium]
LKVRNNVNTNPSQRCWVNVTYEAPSVITNANAATAGNTSSFWTGNGGTSDWNDPYNWEEGKVPMDTSLVIIPSNAFPQPAVVGLASAHHVVVEEGAHLFVHGELNIQSIEGLEDVSGTGVLNRGGETISLATPVLAQFVVYPNPFEDRFDIAVNGVFAADTRLHAELMTTEGRIIQTYSATLSDLNGRLNADMNDKPSGMYLLRIVGGESQVLRLVKQ